MKRISINDIIKAANDSKNFIKALKNASDKVLENEMNLTNNERNKRYYKSN